VGLRAARSWIVLGLGFAVFAMACDRGIGPFDPDEKPSLPDLDQIYPEGARAGKGPGGTGPMAAGPSAEAAPAPAPPPAARGNPVSGADEAIRGRVEIEPSLASQAPPNALLFVIARRHGQVGGPPLAVVRVPEPRFPVEFEIGQAQVMIPSLRFEGEIALSARLDGDGNAMTRLPGDLAGQLADPLPTGARDVTLTLDQRL